MHAHLTNTTKHRYIYVSMYIVQIYMVKRTDNMTSLPIKRHVFIIVLNSVEGGSDKVCMVGGHHFAVVDTT